MARGLAEAMGDGKADTVIPGRLAEPNPESRDFPMRNCASEVWSFGPSRNDDKRPPVRWTMDCFASLAMTKPCRPGQASESERRSGTYTPWLLVEKRTGDTFETREHRWL